MERAHLADLATPGFGMNHLPYGAVSIDGDESALAVRIGDHAVFVRDLLLDGDPPEISRVGQALNLDALLEAGPSMWPQFRAMIVERMCSADAAIAAHPLADVTCIMPFTVADYVDFYASEHHATNVGRLFRPTQAPLLPNWKHLPVGYHGRAGTVGISREVRRPSGLRPEPDGTPSFGPSRKLDIEAEVGFVLGGSTPEGGLSLAAAAEHIFGLVIVNDWSARDVQAFEYVPLGPFLGKSFATTIAPWITPATALQDSRVYPPARDTPLASYLDDTEFDPWGFDLHIEVILNGEIVSRPPFASTYWTAPQMAAHMLINGASQRPGDLLAAGTVSGPNRNERGSLLELTWDGSEPLALSDGSRRSFLEDGDRVTLRAKTARQEPFVQLADCTAMIISAEN